MSGFRNPPPLVCVREQAEQRPCRLCEVVAVATVQLGSETIDLCRSHARDLAWEAVSFVHNELGITSVDRRSKPR